MDLAKGLKLEIPARWRPRFEEFVIGEEEYPRGR